MKQRDRQQQQPTARAAQGQSVTPKATRPGALQPGVQAPAQKEIRSAARPGAGVPGKISWSNGAAQQKLANLQRRPGAPPVNAALQRTRPTQPQGRFIGVMPRPWPIPAVQRAPMPTNPYFPSHPLRAGRPGRARVTIVQPKSAPGRGVIQRSTVTTALRGPVSDTILTELKNMLDAAEAAGGGDLDRSGQLEVLQDLLAKPKVQKLKPGSRETFGLSGADFFGGSQVLIAQGGQQWIQTVKGEAPDAQFLDLSQRSTGIHDEVQHITAYPGVQALMSTQNHCLFCYGLLAMRGYDHGPLRDQPWPSKWKHDYLQFTLDITNADMDAITMNPIIKIECNWGTRYFVVS